MRTLLILFFFFWGFSTIQAKTIVIEHNPQKIIFSKANTYDHVEYAGILNGSPLAAKPGSPDLPVYIYRVVLESGQTIRSFKVTNLEQEALDGSFAINPSQVPWNQESDQKTIQPDLSIYESSTPYPQTAVKFLGVQHFNGKPIAHFAVWPIQYVPSQKKLLFNRHLEIDYTTETAEQKGVQPYLPSDQAVVTSLIRRQNTGNHIQTKFTLPDPTDAIDPALLSSGLIDRYVIITTDALKTSFEALADWKTQRGVPTVIRTLEWIRQNFNGVDDAERMRNFIRWSYHKRGTRYVLLGGDTEVIPTRMIFTGKFSFAADYYFADLDGSWNANQNDLFGQAKDEVESYPEVYVARIPVSNAQEVMRFTQKLFHYEKLDSLQNPDFPTNVLYFAANLQKVNDGRDLITKNIDPMINPSFKRTMLTQSANIGSDVNVALNALNRSYGLIFSEGHGIYYTYRPGAPGSDLYNYHLAELTTPDAGIWYMASCYTNDITKRCFGEDYILSQKGGGVSYIGNSSWEFPFSGVYLEKEFFNLAFNKGYYHLSEAHYLSRLPYLGYLNFEGPSRIIVFSTIVLGDPEMPVWTASVKNFKVNHQLATDRTKQLLEVNVTVDDSLHSPVERAVVVLYKKGAVYKIQRTDASGTVKFDVTGIRLTDVHLTVSKHNFRPWEDQIDLTPDNGFAARLTGFRFEQIQGNGNNQAEPGEKFNLYLTWQNTGSIPIRQEAAITTKNQSPFYRLNNTDFYLENDLQPGDSVTVGPFQCTIGTNIPADTTLAIPVELTNLADQTVSEKIEFNVFVPRLIIARQSWETIVTGDSTSEGNEIRITPTIQNVGHGMATDIQAQLFSNDSLLEIVNGSLNMNALAPNEDKSFDNAFVVRNRGNLEERELQVIFHDHSGLQWMFPVEFKDPNPPSGLLFRTDNERGILLSWAPDSEAHILGYNIFRKENLQKPFTKITSQPVPLAGYFIDSQIRNGQTYYYTIQTVDSSGNASDFSDTLRAWSALPYQNGFPIRPNVKAIGSEVSGVTCFDFDGDGKKELIASGGNGQLHVYDDQGNLLFHTEGLQGDLTYPAVGNVVGNAQKEIVISSFKEGQDENNIYVIDSRNGSVLSQFNLHYNAPSPVVLADLDHDGYDEILALTHAANAPEEPKESRLFILKDSSGVLTSFEDWPKDGYVFENDKLSLGNVAVADLDQSGMQSVIVPTFRSKLFCFNPDTSTNPVWVTQLSGGYLMSPVSVADLNLDGYKEMVVASIYNDKLYVIDHNGNFFPGWEGGKSVDVTDPYGHSSPAIIGNLDDDPELEIMYVGRDSIYIFKADGSAEPNWPKAFFNGEGFYDSERENLAPYNSPVLGDINQDGIQELVFLDTDGYIHAFSTKDGQEISGFPIFTNNDRVNAQSPVLDDIDGDGDLDILTVNHEGVLMAWDAQQKYNEHTFLYWSQPLANPQHTGTLDSLNLTVISGIKNNASANVPVKFYLKPNYPNPFNPSTTIEFALKTPGLVRITVYNILGQKIATLYNDRLLGVGIHRKQWNGKNEFGAEEASGIYFLRMTVKDRKSGRIYFTKTRKMIKLK